MDSGIVFIWLILGIITVLIGQKKNLLGTSIILYLLLGVIGTVILVFIDSGAPKGMYATKCARCTAAQNLPVGQVEYQCWQCKTGQHVFKGVSK